MDLDEHAVVYQGLIRGYLRRWAPDHEDAPVQFWAELYPTVFDIEFLYDSIARRLLPLFRMDRRTRAYRQDPLVMKLQGAGRSAMPSLVTHMVQFDTDAGRDESSFERYLLRRLSAAELTVTSQLAASYRSGVAPLNDRMRGFLLETAVLISMYRWLEPSFYQHMAIHRYPLETLTLALDTMEEIINPQQEDS